MRPRPASDYGLAEPPPSHNLANYIRFLQRTWLVPAVYLRLPASAPPACRAARLPPRAR